MHANGGDDVDDSVGGCAELKGCTLLAVSLSSCAGGGGDGDDGVVTVVGGTVAVDWNKKIGERNGNVRIHYQWLAARSSSTLLRTQLSSYALALQSDYICSRIFRTVSRPMYGSRLLLLLVRWRSDRVIVIIVVVVVEPLRLLEGDGALEHGALQVVGGDVKVAARLRLQVAVVHLHVDDSHEFNLSSELLNLFLEAIGVV